MAESEVPTAQDTVTSASDRLDPWMEDGSIVLAVQGHYFRVHRTVLSSYSEVFKGMFACPEPTGNGEEGEFMEQCPVVHLHHDAVSDVQIVLKAMYDRSYPLPYHQKMPLAVVAAFLHLGEKYDIQSLFNEAKARLCCAFEPTSLNVAAKISSLHAAGTLTLFPDIADSDPHHFQVMNLLHEMDLRAPLPLAMYQTVVACPLSIVVDGYKFNGRVCSLSPANLRAFILVKNVLEHFRIQLAQSLRVSNSCVVQSSCVSHVRRVWSDEVAVGQPLGPWRKEWEKLFCDACARDVCAWRNAAIHKAWNQMPTAFGFDSWAEVAKSVDSSS